MCLRRSSAEHVLNFDPSTNMQSECSTNAPIFASPLTSFIVASTMSSGCAGDTARAATSDEVQDLRREASALKEVVSELTLENRLLKKKRDGGWGGSRLRRRVSPV